MVYAVFACSSNFSYSSCFYLFCLFGGHFNIPFAFETWVLMLCCYAVAVIVVNLLAKMVADIQSNTDWEYKYKHIIAQESVLQALVSSSLITIPGRFFACFWCNQYRIRTGLSRFLVGIAI